MCEQSLLCFYVFPAKAARGSGACWAWCLLGWIGPCNGTLCLVMDEQIVVDLVYAESYTLIWIVLYFSVAFALR